MTVHGLFLYRHDKILLSSPVSYTHLDVYKRQAYMSVMLFGKAEKVTDPEEASVTLQKLVEKYLPKYYSCLLYTSRCV